MIELVTGGSGSGKSAFAEDRILSFGERERIYIATMFPFDEESRKRILRHQNMRADKGFCTIECFTDIGSAPIPLGSCVLLECMSNLTANEMYQEGGAGEETVRRIMDGIRILKQKACCLIIVSNEVFSDGITYDPETQRYLSYLGEINQAVAEMAEVVTEVVYGIPITVKSIHGQQQIPGSQTRMQQKPISADETERNQ